MSPFDTCLSAGAIFKLQGSDQLIYLSNTPSVGLARHPALPVPRHVR